MDAAQDWWFLLNHFLDKVDNFLALTIQFQFTIKCWYFIGFLIPTKEDNLKIIEVSKSRVFSSSFILIDKLEMVFHIFPSQKKKTVSSSSSEEKKLLADFGEGAPCDSNPASRLRVFDTHLLGGVQPARLWANVKKKQDLHLDCWKIHLEKQKKKCLF